MSNRRRPLNPRVDPEKLESEWIALMRNQLIDLEQQIRDRGEMLAPDEFDEIVARFFGELREMVKVTAKAHFFLLAASARAIGRDLGSELSQYLKPRTSGSGSSKREDRVMAEMAINREKMRGGNN